MMGKIVQQDLVANPEESRPKTDSKHVAPPEATTTPDAVFVIEEAVPPMEAVVEETTIVPDGGWGWIVSVATMCCCFIVFVIKGSSGLFLIALIDKFDEPVWKLTLVGSILNGLSLLSAPISSMLLIYFSHRKVAITAGLIGFTGAILGAFSTSSDMMIACYGILGGLALGFGYFTSQIIVTLYFSKKRATALSIASCGSGLGTCVGNIMVEKLLQTYGLTGTLLMIAGMMFNMVVCGVLYRPLPTKTTIRHNPEYKTTNILEIKDRSSVTEIKNDWDGTRQGITNQAISVSESSLDVQNYKTDAGVQRKISQIKKKKKLTFKEHCLKILGVSVLKNFNFLYLLVSYFFISTRQIAFQYFPVFMLSFHLERDEIAVLMSIFGIWLTIGQLFVGVIVDLFHLNSKIVHVLSQAVIGATIVCLPHCGTFVLLAVVLSLTGLAAGFTVSLRLLITTEVTGREKCKEGFSMINLITGIVFSVGSPLFGLLYDVTKSLKLVYYISGSCQFLAVACVFIIWYRMRKCQQ